MSPKYDMTAGIPYEVLQHRREFGQSRSLLQCPFCHTQFWAYWWSICGSGKRCENKKCGALHLSGGSGLPDAQGSRLWGAKSMIDIYTDGACNPNPGPGAWAYHIPAKGIDKAGIAPRTTNNRMEMQAIIEALSATAGPVRIFSDSRVAINVITGRWKAKENLDLILSAHAVMDGRDVTFEWVKGHNWNVGNERADMLATTALKRFKAKRP